MKKCGKCQIEKPVSEFHKNRARKDGLQHRCKSCARKSDEEYRSRPEFAEQATRYGLAYRNKNRDRLAEVARQRYRENPDLWRARAYQERYGITIEQYDEMFAAQGGVCAICGSPPGSRRLAVDHDHETNAVRSLLCGDCNKGIGCLRDDPERLRAAAAYLESHKHALHS